MRVLIVTGGTRGDVDPLFALHRALERAGHSVLFAGPPDFAHLRERGVDYLPVGSEARAWAEDWGRRPPTRAVLR
ncbi:MAG: glycosyltransferase, partial [Sandaracinaceae bacterium]|nr:glycosyltransferase [Sandaracinaceae bacterium]